MIKKNITSLFLKLGWNTGRMGGDKILRFNSGKFVYRIFIQEFLLKKNIKISINVFSSTHDFIEISEKLVGDTSMSHIETILIDTEFFLEECKDENLYFFVINTHNKIIKLLNNEEVSYKINKYHENCPDRPAHLQYAHLTSLVIMKKSNKLSDYLLGFERGVCFNFIPIIDKKCIEAAYFLSLE